MLNSDPQPIPNEVLEQASAWVLRLEDHPGDQALLEQHQAWLHSSAMHRRAWALACGAWDMAGQIEHETTDSAQAMDIRPVDSPDNVRSLQAARMGKRVSTRGKVPRFRSALGWATAAAAAVFVILGVQPFMLWLNADITTDTGQTQTLALEDGSTIMIGADTALAYEFTSQRRAVTLLKGEAWFDVADDSSRPFVVNTGDLNVTVTGTQFNVGKTEQTVSVALAEGSVQIDRTDQEPSIALSAGQRFRLDLASGRAKIAQIDPAQMGAWRSNRFVVQDMLLADVVDTLDRYYAGTIHIWHSERVDDVRITGVFDLSEPKSALNTLARSYDASVLELTPWVTVIAPD